MLAHLDSRAKLRVTAEPYRGVHVRDPMDEDWRSYCGLDSYWSADSVADPVTCPVCRKHAL